MNLKNAEGMAVALFDYKDQDYECHCLSFAGTRTNRSTIEEKLVMIHNVLTDVFQFISGPSKVYFASVGILKSVMDSFPKDNVYVFGHSLGGGFAQYSCAAMNQDRISGYCYHSAGLSNFSLKTLGSRLSLGQLKSQIHHICSQFDPVSYFGKLVTGSNVKYVRSSRDFSSHCLKQLNEVINGHELKVKY